MNKFSPQIEKRISETISCHDCDHIPKVHNAGEVVLDADPPYQIMHNGVKVVLGGYHGGWMQKIISELRGHHEPQEEKVFHELLNHLRANPVMLELGSFWSYYSLWFKHSFPTGTNYLVEPVRFKLDMGQRNFELNNFAGNFIQGCIGTSYEKEHEFLDWNGDKLFIPQYSVDSLLEQNEIEFLDILHSDIQGAELDMLDGCKNSIANGKIGFFCISTHLDRHNKCIKFFNEHNLHIIAEHSPKESASVDGLIVAQSKLVPLIDNIEITRRSF